MPPNKPQGDKPQGDKVPYDQAAAQAVGQVQGDAPDAGESLGRMSTDRPERLPAEDEQDALMAKMRDMQQQIDSMRGEVTSARTDYQAARAALGPPEVATYGQAIRDKLISLRDANPDVPPGHFDAVLRDTAELGQASAELARGEGETSHVSGLVPDAVAAVERHITRSRRTSGKYLDYSALEADLELAQAAAE
jgi:hypothetical protein